MTANIHLVVPVIDRNYDIKDVATANLVKSRELFHNTGHVVIPVIDRNHDKNDVVTANLAKSLELYRNSSHSPDLGVKQMKCI